MVMEAIRRSFSGLGFAAIITFIVLTIMMVQDVQVSVTVIWKNMLGSMVMGIYFGSSSLIFDIEKWSPLKQTAIHFVLSVGVWIPLAIVMGWLPLELFPVLIGIGSFIVVYLIFWYGLYVYFKRVEDQMNNSVKK